MDINAKTKIDALLKQYPYLEDFLITLSPKFKGLKNQIMRKTMGKVVTLEMAATVSGLITAASPPVTIHWRQNP